MVLHYGETKNGWRETQGETQDSVKPRIFPKKMVGPEIPTGTQTVKTPSVSSLYSHHTPGKNNTTRRFTTPDCPHPPREVGHVPLAPGGAFTGVQSPHHQRTPQGPPRPTAATATAMSSGGSVGDSGWKQVERVRTPSEPVRWGKYWP